MGPSYKALLPIGGRPCIQYVLDALELPAVDRVCLVGPEEELRSAIRNASGYEYVAGGVSFGDSIFRGLDHFRDSGQVLLTTGDLPLLTCGSVAEFLDFGHRRSRAERKVFLSGAPASSFTGPYRFAPKKCSHFRDITICHGNLLLLSSRALENTSRLSRNRIDRIYRQRKKPFSPLFPSAGLLSSATCSDSVFSAPSRWTTCCASLRVISNWSWSPFSWITPARLLISTNPKITLLPPRCSSVTEPHAPINRHFVDLRR